MKKILKWYQWTVVLDTLGLGNKTYMYMGRGLLNESTPLSCFLLLKHNMPALSPLPVDIIGNTKAQLKSGLLFVNQK